MVHSITHTVQHHAYNGNGYEVCACGATRFVVHGKPEGGWHTCPLCTLSTFHEKEKTA